MTNASVLVVPPAGAAIVSASSDALAVLVVAGQISPLGMSGYFRVPVLGLSRGQARLQVNYTDGTSSHVHYFVQPPFSDLLSSYASFATTTAWLDRSTQEPFGRSASVIPYDREDNVTLLQDARPFIVGLSDDAGAGATLGLSAKNLFVPVAAEIARLDEYVDWTLQGVKPDVALPPLFSLQDPSTQRILMTMFYFDNPALNTTTYYTESDKCNFYPSWCSFNAPYPGHPADWIATYRAFNFPHQTAGLLALYRVARDWPGIPTEHAWDWYLTAAYNLTATVACYDPGSNSYGCIPTVGLMDDTVFLYVLETLLAEGWVTQAQVVDGIMRARTLTGVDGAPGWMDQDYPPGSEFSWDTTGFEAVGVWGSYYNAVSSTHGDLAARIADYVLAFMPTAPNWALNGAALGAGDFSNNAKYMVTGGWERDSGHYRSGLNSIPLYFRYMRNPDAFYLLQTAIGGTTNVLPNIDERGAASMSWHTHPFIHAHDPNSGDYGLAMFGHTAGVGSYLVQHPSLGWLCFLCDINIDGNGYVELTPRDSLHVRVFIEPLGALLWAQTGSITSFRLQPSARSAQLVFAAPAQGEPLYDTLRLSVTMTAPRTRPFNVALRSAAPIVRGAYAIPAGPGEVGVMLGW